MRVFLLRDFRRLPPLLRVVSIVALLFWLAAFGLLVSLLIVSSPPFSRWPAETPRLLAVALNLLALSWACSCVVAIYRLRFRLPGNEPFPLSSWQRQLWVLALLAALPLCGTVLALVVPLTASAFFLPLGITIFAMFGTLRAYPWTVNRVTNRRAVQLPRPTH